MQQIANSIEIDSRRRRPKLRFLVAMRPPN